MRRLVLPDRHMQRDRVLRVGGLPDEIPPRLEGGPQVDDEVRSAHGEGAQEGGQLGHAGDREEQQRQYEVQRGMEPGQRVARIALVEGDLFILEKKSPIRWAIRPAMKMLAKFIGCTAVPPRWTNRAGRRRVGKG